MSIVIEPSTVLHGLHTLHIDGQPIAITFPHEGRWLIDLFADEPGCEASFATEAEALLELQRLAQVNA